MNASASRSHQEINMTSSLLTRFSAALLMLGALNSPLNAQSTVADASAKERDNSPYALVGVGPDERIWSAGDSQSARRIVEIGTGLNYWDGQNWVPSEPIFEATPNGFVADRIQHKVRILDNLNQPEAVTVITPDGITLHSTPVAIGLYSPESGQSVIIASIKDSTGVLVDDRRVVYEDAFSGAVCADVVYTIDRDSFSQDVVITGRLDPADWGFSANSLLQIFTEFYEPPEPESVRRPIRIEQNQAVRHRMVSPDLIDEALGFGELVLATGRAATLANISNFAAPAAPVAKQFTSVAGRTFLIESVDYGLVQGDLKSLPECPPEIASAKSSQDRKRGKLAELAIPSASRSTEQAKVTPKPAPARMARASTDKRVGFVIDYLATIGGTISSSKVFQGDTTYFLTNAVTCNGAVTIEGGAVFKFPTNSTSCLKLTSTVTCKTSSYRPAIFTAADDDTVGDKITTNIWSGYTGNIQSIGYGNPALWAYFLSSPALSHLRFRYSQEAVRFEGGSGLTGSLSHAQLVNCIRGIVISGCGCAAATITVNNSLLAGVQKPLSINFSGSSGNFYHGTVDRATHLITSSVGSASGSFYNSVLANVTNLYSGTANAGGNHNGFYSCTTFGTSQYSSSNYPFQSVGAGNYYLASGSPFRNVGITNGLGASLLTELKMRTTFPPQILTNPVTVATTLSPQAQRDTDTLDLGFHYEALDWAVNGVAVTNVVLTLTNGVALAAFGNSGICLQGGSQFYSEGTPLQHNHLTRFFNVQEQPINWGGGSSSSMYTIDPSNSGSSPPIAQLRFTDFDGITGSGYHLYTLNTNWTLSSLLLQDCSLNSALFYLDGPTNSTLSLNNNLFERVTVSCKSKPIINAYNNLFRYGTNSVSNTGTGNWIFKDNAFDNSWILDTGNAVTAAFNAYINMGTNRFYPTNASDLVLTSFTYTNSTLGSYYQLSTNFYNMGSRNATNAGLYHYTVQISQPKETNSIVDIGFHYVAVSNGLPVDTDGDGAPDYLEDRNGDGNGANDSTSWQTYNSPNGLTNASDIKIFTPLK